jgi:putative intracellular protease/amidase
MTKILLLICLALTSCSIHQKNSKTVLIILSGESELILKGNKSFKTGFFLNELMVPVIEMQKNAINLVFTTPSGNLPTLDKGSDDLSFFASKEEYRHAKSSLKDLGLLENAKIIKSFEEVKKMGLSMFDGIFVPGGHAPMVDLAKSKELGEILTHFNSEKKPTALVCHGPVALLSTVDKTKKWIYKDYKMTVFSNKEEKIAEKSKLKGLVPFYPETALKEAGANIQNGKEWQSNVVEHKELITGQNPSSDKALIAIFIKKLK